MRDWKAVLALLILSPVLAELISESTPLHAFVQPGMVLFYLLGYGFPVLVIREWAVARGLSRGGIYVAGIGYGIFNEGLFAKTFILPGHLPIPGFDGYGTLWGIHWPWVALICLWHAMASVLFPIMFVHALFPAAKDRLWLNPKLTGALGILMLVLACAAFMGKDRIAGTPVQLAIFLAIMAACGGAALGMKHGKPGEESGEKADAPLSVGPVVLGLGVLLVNVVLSAMAGGKLPVALFFLALGGIVWGCIHWMKRRGWLAPVPLSLFACGCYMESALLGTGIKVATHSGAGEAIVTGLVAEGVFLWVAYRLIHGSAGETAAKELATWR